MEEIIKYEWEWVCGESGKVLKGDEVGHEGLWKGRLLLKMSKKKLEKMCSEGN